MLFFLFFFLFFIPFTKHLNFAQTWERVHLKKIVEKIMLVTFFFLFFFFPTNFCSRSWTSSNTQSFPKQHILVSTKHNAFADDNCKFDENGRKLSSKVENTVGKEKFLIFPQCFKGLVLQTCKNTGLFWKGINQF